VLTFHASGLQPDHDLYVCVFKTHPGEGESYTFNSSRSTASNSTMVQCTSPSWGSLYPAATTLVYLYEWYRYDVNTTREVTQGQITTRKTDVETVEKFIEVLLSPVPSNRLLATRDKTFGGARRLQAVRTKSPTVVPTHLPTPPPSLRPSFRPTGTPSFFPTHSPTSYTLFNNRFNFYQVLQTSSFSSSSPP